ncbi:MAG: DUF1801 domain-containing protein [Chitinophagales bacterium]|nr:DUF1801 domain-containing protein [Chitinophagales bacterium]HAE13808.1 hypothetical protein [Bacteroidota bacterium]MCB9022379.1 DUF1801 domain-containing protein [Chitinophagales bacterium]HAE34969.1 hypothetical protein [Bacteroidota bacterium]HPE97488.1 DUF1801 domain-containing protein [Chitinophagales bacterium]
MKKPATVDAYLKEFPDPVKSRMEQIRAAIKKAAPDAEEMISYGMPAYKTFARPLVYYAGYEHHIGLYATPTGQLAFAKELAGYKQGKGSVQFPNDAPFPLPLIKKIIAFRVAENRDKYAPKATKKITK